MPQFKGNTSSSALSTAYNIVSRIKSFSIVNKSGGALTFNVGILYGSTFSIAPLNKSLAAGEEYVVRDCNIDVPAEHQISVTSTGSIDYYFTIE